MRRFLRTFVWATAAFWAAVAIFMAFTLPRPRAILAAPMPATEVLGAYHIHTNRSDGTGDVDSIAAQAARAGLRFLIFTDHGDATRPPDPPAYRNGVLCVDAVEISTGDGHLVALGLTKAAPYRLAGGARDVLEDIHRLGGHAVIAHPDSPAAALRWTGPTQGFDGIEWLNVDAEWRDESATRLLATALRSLVRPPEAIASLLGRPTRTLQRWDTASRQRPVFGVAALDAHARIGWNDTEEPRQRTALARPTYEQLFDTVAEVVDLDAPLSGRADRDAEVIVAALVGGRAYSLIRALAGPASLQFSAERGSERFRMGDRAMVTPSAPAVFHAAVPGAPEATLTLYVNGQAMAHGRGALTATAAAAGVYRLEVGWPGAAVPWIVSNPIVFDEAGASPFTARPLPALGSERRLIPVQSASGVIERDASSTLEHHVEGAALRFDYHLGPGEAHGQYAALAIPVVPDVGIDRVEFTARSDRPMRLSLQVRLPGGKDSERWRRSVFLDETPRSIVVRLQDFEPAERPTTRRPIVTPIQTLMFVVDTVNAAPDTSGTVWLSGMALGIDRLTDAVRSGQ